MAGDELPGGGVAGDEVEMGAQQQRRNHHADEEEQEGEEEEQVALKPDPGERLEIQAGPFEGERETCSNTKASFVSLDRST